MPACDDFRGARGSAKIVVMVVSFFSCLTVNFTAADKIWNSWMTDRFHFIMGHNSPWGGRSKGCTPGGATDHFCGTTYLRVKVS